MMLPRSYLVDFGQQIVKFLLKPSGSVRLSADAPDVELTLVTLISSKKRKENGEKEEYKDMEKNIYRKIIEISEMPYHMV